jgi:hypothetical protein
VLCFFSNPECWCWGIIVEYRILPPVPY